MDKKPILVIDLRSIQDFKKTGVHIAGENWIKQLLRNSKNDEKIILWTNSHKRVILPKNWLHKKNIQHIHTKIPNLLLNILWGASNFLNLEKILKINQPYIYFSPDIRPFPRSKQQIKSITYIHDIAFIKRPKDFSLKSRIWFTIINPSKIVKNSTIILTNSKFSKTEIQTNFQLPNQKIQIIYPSLPQKLPIKDLEAPFSNYYLCISSLQKRKNLHQVIQTFQQNPNQNLIILGNHLKTFSKQNYKLPSNIKIISNISNSKKHFLIKHSEALIYPSTYEGFGLPILEGIRFGKLTYTNPIKPFTEIFPKQILNINQFPQKNKENKKIFKKHISLKKQTRKLKNTIYNP